MIASIQKRIAGFALAIVVTSVTIAWAAYITWQQADNLRDRLTNRQIKSFQTAEQFDAFLLSLDYTLLRYVIHRDKTDWDKFLQDSKNLDRWIDVQRPLLTTEQEGRILDQINTAYDYYLAAGKTLENLDSNEPPDRRLKRFSDVERESARLRDFQDQLLKAHRASLDQFLAASQKSLAMLRGLTFGALFVLLILGIWLASVVYREMIAPLHRKLVESHAIIDRQEKLASLGVLAAGVAHEIRNPLTAIKARLFTLQRALEPGSAELGDSAMIGDEINRLEGIVKDFLEFARPTEPKLAVMTPETPLREVRDLLSPEMEKRGIKIEIEAIAEARFLADPRQLKQVLINLIQNSADSIGARGRIALRAKRDTTRLTGQDRAVVILEVSDTGKGIPAEIQRRLFDPFFTTKEDGTGLGLAIAARIVEKHSGALEFQTAVNRGTTFGVVLPVIGAA